MPSTIVWIAAVLIGAFLISYVDYRLFNRHARRNGQATEPEPAPTLAPIELVIARQIDGWLAAPQQTARIYAEGLVTGKVTAVTDAADWEYVPTTLGHAIDQIHEASGFHWTIDAEEWQIGIGSIHGLAHGVIECYETGRRFGVQTDLNMSWLLYAHDLEGTGLTMDEVADAFTGDLLAAAHAYLRACEALPIRW
ncbi:hypothetical protein [Actinokineospora enzanensis]|uniref:hypothetical protein n=1 Tax=Actinokineospora enzanensis TaxID=155975 RepID=UPI000377F69B|nr:hypothetical protein [Actinokineospora enzanensis]